MQAVKRELAEKAAQAEAQAEAGAASRSDPEANAAKFLSEWDALSEAERRGLLRALVASVTLRGKKTAVALR